MKDFARKKGKKVSKVYSLPVLIVTFIIFGLLIKSNIEIYSKVKHSSERKELNQFEYDNLAKRKLELEAQVKQIDSKIGLEEELRTRFGLAKDDEKLVILYDDENIVPEKLDEENKTFFEKFKSWFSE